jgi:hypothetical protein
VCPASISSCYYGQLAIFGCSLFVLLELLACDEVHLRGLLHIKSFLMMIFINFHYLNDAHDVHFMVFAFATSFVSPYIIVCSCFRILIKQMSKFLVTIHAMDHAVALSNQYSFKIQQS